MFSDTVPGCLRLLLPIGFLWLLAPFAYGQNQPDSSGLLKTFRHRDLGQIEKSLYDPFSQNGISGKSTGSEAWGGQDALLQTTGSLSRGITVGNGRDLSVDSYLDLHIQGTLSERLTLSAHISDRNLPLQSATSQQWQEFDRIFIRLDYLSLKGSSMRLFAGDVDLKENGSWFLRFSRQGLGASFRYVSADSSVGRKRGVCSVSMSEAVAKGTFRRQQIEAREGVQGGYRLTGAQGESQIIVLSASEKVYIDGVLLKQGEDADYTIDYQLAEITFTARQPITRDKRIVVEFEYSDRQYVRSLTHLQTSYDRNAWRFSFDFYNEQDLKHQTSQWEWDAASLAFMQSLNRGGSVYYPYADSSGFLPNEPLYFRTDTVVQGVRYDSVYVYATDDGQPCYRLRFSYLGEGKGNYVAVRNGVNGQVYAWVAPLDGQPQGSYEPVVLLLTPQRRQMYSFRTEYNGKRSGFMAEAALSNHDANTFSKKEPSAPGAAFRTSCRTLWQWGAAEKLWSLTPVLYYEGKAACFGAVDAYREVEFVRNFNLADSLTLHKGEHYAEASLRLNSPRNNLLQWQSTAYLIPASSWTALRHGLLMRERLRGFSADADAHWLETRADGYRTSFIRHKEVISQKAAFLRIGLIEDMEWNRYVSQFYDSLMPESRAYNELTFFIQPADTAAALRYRLQCAQRNDFSVWDNLMQSSSAARQLQAEVEWLKFANHPLRFSVSYRSIDARDSQFVLQETEHTLLGALNYQGRWARGAVQTGWYATLGSALENKMQYSYLKVAEGQGVYQWIDYNGNGIEELDEFEVAVYRDQANYVRVNLIGQEQEKVYATTWTQSLVLRPEAVWRDSRGIRRLLSLFSNSTSFQSQLKKSVASIESSASPWVTLLDPFATELSDTVFRSGSLQFRDMLSFLPSNSVCGAEGSYIMQNNKYLTVNGFEYTSSETWQAVLRYRLFGSLLSRFSFSHVMQGSTSDYFNSRNYKLSGEQSLFSLQYPVSNRLSLSLAYSYRWQRNEIGLERLFSNSVEGETTYRMPKRGSLCLKCRYVHIRFDGNANSPVAYVMTESLSAGPNGVMDAAYQMRVGEYLQLDFSYEGRLSTEGLKHTGTVTVKALF